MGPRLSRERRPCVASFPACPSPSLPPAEPGDVIIECRDHVPIPLRSCPTCTDADLSRAGAGQQQVQRSRKPPMRAWSTNAASKPCRNMERPPTPGCRNRPGRAMDLGDVRLAQAEPGRCGEVGHASALFAGRRPRRRAKPCGPSRRRSRRLPWRSWGGGGAGGARAQVHMHTRRRRSREGPRHDWRRREASVHRASHAAAGIDAGGTRRWGIGYWARAPTVRMRATPPAARPVPEPAKSPARLRGGGWHVDENRLFAASDRVRRPAGGVEEPAPRDEPTIKDGVREQCNCDART